MKKELEEKIYVNTLLGLSNIFSSDESEIYIHDGDALLIINSKI